MAVVVPSIYTPVHREEVEGSVTEETLRKMIHNNNFLLNLRPIRSIIWVEVNQSGVPPIDLSVWQQCDGSEITNPNSPLRSIGATQRFTPDYRDRYPRVASGPLGPNDSDGSQTLDLQHDHGGSTGLANPTPPFIYESGGQERSDQDHSHLIAEQYTDSEFLDAPAFVKLIAYMRIV